MIFKKFPLLSIVLSIVGILLSVFAFIMIQVASKVNNVDDGLSLLAIVELVISVLFLAALTARKPAFTKVISIITTAILMTVSFAISIVSSVAFQSNNVTWDSISYLSISVLTLVVLVLFFVYFLIGRKGVLKSVSKILNIISIVFLGLFAVLVLLSSFVGIFRNRPLYGLEMVILILNTVLFQNILLSLFGNLDYKEKETPKEKPVEEATEEVKE